MKSTGLILLIVGLSLTIFNAFKFFTREKVLDLGVVEITKNQPHYFSWSPIIGIIIMAIGLFILLRSPKN